MYGISIKLHQENLKCLLEIFAIIFLRKRIVSKSGTSVLLVKVSKFRLDFPSEMLEIFIRKHLQKCFILTWEKSRILIKIIWNHIENRLYHK